MKEVVHWCNLRKNKNTEFVQMKKGRRRHSLIFPKKDDTRYSGEEAFS